MHIYSATLTMELPLAKGTQATQSFEDLLKQEVYYPSVPPKAPLAQVVQLFKCQNPNLTFCEINEELKAKIPLFKAKKHFFKKLSQYGIPDDILSIIEQYIHEDYAFKPYKKATLMGHNKLITALAMGGKNRLISASGDGTLKIWNLKKCVLVQTLEGHVGPIDALAVTHDGDATLIVGSARAIMIWKNYSVLSELQGDTTWAEALAIKSDNQTLFACGDNTIKVGSLENNNIITTWNHDHVKTLALAPNCQLLASGSWNGSIKIWDLKNSTLIKTVDEHTNNVNALVITPDNKKLISGSGDDTIKIWDLEKLSCITTLSTPNSLNEGLAITPDGNTLISGADGIISLWNLKNNTLITMLPENGRGISKLAITPDGVTLAAASYPICVNSGKPTISLWQLRSDLPILNTHDWRLRMYKSFLL